MKKFPDTAQTPGHGYITKIRTPGYLTKFVFPPAEVLRIKTEKVTNLPARRTYYSHRLMLFLLSGEEPSLTAFAPEVVSSPITPPDAIPLHLRTTIILEYIY